MITREGHPVDSPHTASWPRAPGPEFLLKGQSAEATSFAQESCHNVSKLCSQVFRCERLVRGFWSGDGEEGDGTAMFGIYNMW